MLKKRRIKRTIPNSMKKLTSTFVACECGREELVRSDIGAVTCSWCVQLMLAPPVGYKKSAEEKSATPKPRGWHFKPYFEHDGKVYSRGKEVTDAKEIQKLKVSSSMVTKKVAKKVVKKKAEPLSAKKKRTRKNAKTTK